jgi:hypothetical protein
VTFGVTGIPTLTLVSFLGKESHRFGLVILQVREKVLTFGAGLPTVKWVWRIMLRLLEQTLVWIIKKLVSKDTILLVVRDINDVEAVKDALGNFQGPVILVRGGKLISPEVIRCFRGTWINIHGGILPNYRGLDSHLWAASKREFHLIGVTAHILQDRVDSGRVLSHLFLPSAERYGWLCLTWKVKELENQLAKEILEHEGSPIQIQDYNSSESRYYSKFPRVLGVFPKWKA